MRELANSLTDKEWREVLDNYLLKGLIRADDYCRMSDRQKDIINEIKKHKARQKNHETNYRS